jgi:hypothetical protein
MRPLRWAFLSAHSGPPLSNTAIRSGTGNGLGIDLFQERCR